MFIKLLLCWEMLFTCFPTNLFNKENFINSTVLSQLSEQNKKVCNDNVLIGQVNIHYQDTFIGWFSAIKWSTKKQIILQGWNKYANNWNDFTEKYEYLSFNNNLLINYQTPYQNLNEQNVSIKTKNILLKQEVSFDFKVEHVWFMIDSFYLQVGCLVWHDDFNIYLDVFVEEFSLFERNDSSVNVNFVSYIFK